MRNKRGITLVSLVVTIIVLIILAGVSINLTVGENGIITMAKKARENMELATIEEQTKLNALYTQIRLEDENIGGIDNSSISKLIEFKQKVASAITDMGIETLETANADTMASNIRRISTNNDAVSISYDNTNSELTSTNVQEAVDEIDSEIDGMNEKIGWKYLGSTTQQNSLTLPENFEELYIIVGRSSSQYKDVIRLNIPRIAINPNGETIIIQIGEANYNTGAVAFLGLETGVKIVNATSINVDFLWFIRIDRNEDITDYARLFVYYR